jgi:hypothetical protein
VPSSWQNWHRVAVVCLAVGGWHRERQLPVASVVTPSCGGVRLSGDTAAQKMAQVAGDEGRAVVVSEARSLPCHAGPPCKPHDSTGDHRGNERLGAGKAPHDRRASMSGTNLVASVMPLASRSR